MGKEGRRIKRKFVSKVYKVIFILVITRYKLW